MGPKVKLPGVKYRVHKKLTPLNLVSRNEWGAVNSTEGNDIDVFQMIEHPVKRTIISYSRDEICIEPHECVKRMRDLQKRDQDEGLPDLRYNFYVGNDGNVYEGRGWLYTPFMNPYWPEFFPDNYEVCHIGFHGRHLPLHMSKAAYDLVQFGVSKGYITEEGKMYPNIFEAQAEGLF